MKAPKVLIAAVFLCFALSGCAGGSEPASDKDAQREKLSEVDYVVAEEVEHYSQGSAKGASYRVAVPPDTAEDELQAVFFDVVAGDGCAVRTVWFYSDARLTDGAVPCDVASAVQESPDADPVIVFADEAAKAKAQASLEDAAGA